MPGLTLDIRFGSPLHRLILDSVRDRVQFSKRKFQNRHEKWRKAEERALAFLPETETDAKRRLLRDQGKPQYTTIQIPYSYAILMASHTYWTTVFLSRAPVLQISARHGESAQQVQAVEALMAYQVQVGEMLVPWYIWLLDLGKYGLGITGEFWEERTVNVSQIVEKEEMLLGVIPTGKVRKVKQVARIPGYAGNTIFNVRPFDFFPDPRVAVQRFQKGEFCATYGELGWNEILRREERGLYVNIDKLRPGARGGATVREEGSAQLELPDTDETFSSSVADRKSGDIVKIYECHVELVPKLWNLGKGAHPEKWVFTVTSDYEIVLGAQPLGAWHDKFPFNVIELEPEGYAITNRGIPDILEPIQNTMDFLINSHFYNVRKALNDQFIVDPSRIVMADAQDPLPGGLIRLTPEAYGTDPATAMKQLQVVDLTQSHLRDIQFMNDLGQRASGVSDSILGLLQQGGRKTAQEIRTATGFGINRLKTTSEYASAMGWSPMVQKLVQNTQQYYTAEKKFRIVGDLALEAGKQFIDVNPESIQGFYDFVPVDGTLPVDRFAQANLWRELFAQMRNFPEIMEQYDIGRIFAWVAQLSGLKNINQFKVQVLPDEQLEQQAQAGNVIPLGGAAPNLPDLERVPTGQVSNLGTIG